MDISTGKLFKRVFCGLKTHVILYFNVVKKLRFAVPKQCQRSVSDGGVHPVEKFTLGRIVLIDILKNAEHSIVDRREYIVFFFKKVFTQGKQYRVKLTVQFFLTLTFFTPATR